MDYKQDFCKTTDYFVCSETLVSEKPATKKLVKEIPSQKLPLDSSSYDSHKEFISKKYEENIDSPTTKISEGFYQKTSVRVRKFRVIKK